MQFLGWATGAAEKIVTNQECYQSVDLLFCLHIFLSSSTIVCANLPSIGYSTEKLRTSSLAQLFSTSQTASNVIIPTASAQNYSSTPHHNSVPPHSRVINLHAHSVAAAMHSFLYNISHTPRERSPMHSHAAVMERQPQKKETANKANLNPKIRKCSHWCGDLISCYTMTSSSFMLNFLWDHHHSC